VTVALARRAARATPVLVVVLLAAIGLAGIAARGDATAPDGRRAVDGTAVAMLLPVGIGAGDIGFPEDSLARSGRVEPGTAIFGVDTPAPDAPCGPADSGRHHCARVTGARLPATGATTWHSRAPPRAGFDTVHA
jgi:hypothetical protein